jgi:tRNA threonylcarbamoyladenosine biosynthesis protein TsaE
LAKKLATPRRKRALVIALQGDLGAGKTTFTQGFARGLGIKRRMASPTFIIMRRFALPRSSGNIYHIDAYRLKKLDSLEVLGFKEILADPKNVILIEWPEKIKKILPRQTIWLKFQYGKKENERKITIK